MDLFTCQNFHRQDSVQFSVQVFHVSKHYGRHEPVGIRNIEKRIRLEG